MNLSKDTTSSLDTTYSIEGFRSLRGFSISLKPGVNVLVGPNGSGKTNYIEFLDFLDHMLRQGATNAVSSAGGVARVFSLENIKKASPSVVANVRGVAEITVNSQNLENSIFNFEYLIEIRFSRPNSAIYIAKELLRIKKLRNLNEPKLATSTVGHISLTRRFSSDETPPSLEVTPRLFAESDRNPLKVMPNYSSTRPVKDILSRIEPNLLAPDESLLSSRASIPAIDAIRIALTRGRSFNIIPARAREPDDLTRPPLIGRDGSGLSSTLHFLQLAKRARKYRRPFQLRRVTPESLEMVIQWTKLVFPQLEDISVTQDPHTGKYLGHLVVGHEPLLRIPLQSASDGTLKWLALVCLIITSGGAYSIEEPENFLHPKMQQFLIDLIRDALATETRAGYFIVSTHSETLINRCRAEELILFEFAEGKTCCKRISNPDQVKAEINKTGFGLGYYYASNALS